MTDRSQDLDVVVLGGGGHVGLPLSLAFADAGLRVGIYDTNQATLDRIAAGEMPFLETGAEDLLRRLLPTGRLEFGTGGDMIERTDQLVVVIGTPVDEFLGPSMTIFEQAVGQIAPHLRDGALVVMRSTVYPGTTEYVATALRDRGCRVDVAVCPERIAEGHALEELSGLPQIVGADDAVVRVV
jgi:UDP-N-acetyl-D-mannosaminuronic acid dehydrogenase